MERTDRQFFVWNAAVSTLAVAFIAYILRREATPSGGVDLSFVPALNALFNALSATCLVAGYLAIRRKAVQVHRFCMVAAFALSAVFLVGYLAYHYVHGDTRYPGAGASRGLYLALLASHVILSIPVVPLCLAAFYYALTKRFETHKRITKVLYPMWLYVSVTGVVVFFLLRSAY
jgi:putative membrane protein